MKSIKFRILISFVLTFLIIGMSSAIFISLKLDKTLDEQSIMVSNDLTAIVTENLVGYQNMFVSTIDSMGIELMEISEDYANHPYMRVNAEMFRVTELTGFLEKLSSKFDYAVLLDLEGNHIASYPSDIGANVDVRWIENYYKSWDLRKKVQDFLKKGSQHGKNRHNVHELSFVKEHDYDFIEAFKLTDRNFVGDRFISRTSAAIVTDDFQDPIAVLVTGTMLNGHEAPLKKYYEATGLACAIYSGRYPITHYGFANLDDASENTKDLQINEDILRKIYNADKPVKTPISIAGINYYTTCLKIRDSDGKNIGIFLVGIPQKQVIESEQAFLSYGVQSIKNLKTWFIILGTAALFLFITISLFIAAKIANPINKLLLATKQVAKGNFSQKIDINSSDEIGRLSQAYNTMVKQLSLQRNQLESAKETAEAANRAKSDFLTNMSHELRTPLNHIIGFTELVLDSTFGELNASQKEYLTDVLNSSNHLLSLINDILDLSKVEAGKMEMQATQIGLDLILHQSLKMVQQKAIKHQIQLNYESSDIPKAILADERKLKQVLYNLLSNAVKFTSDSGKINISAQKIFLPSDSMDDSKMPSFVKKLPKDNGEQKDLYKECIQISVSDTGIGLTAEHLDLIFKPFEQVDSSASRKYQGTGLGLSLTRTLVKLHAGNLYAESEGLGKGSTFHIFLPIHFDVIPDPNNLDNSLEDINHDEMKSNNFNRVTERSNSYLSDSSLPESVT